MREIDFTLFKDKNQSRTFAFTNDDDTVYDMTGSTVKLLLYLTSTPLEISGSVTILTGKVIFNFLATDLTALGKYEYLVEETTSGLTKIPLTKGNLTVSQYVPFSESIEAYLASELPTDITLTEDYRSQRITYWRRFLMNAFYVGEGNLNVDSAWQPMQNAFIAKLIAYDVLMLAAKGSIMHIFGTATIHNETALSGGDIKKIVTGPSEVEFFSGGDGLEKIMKAGPQGSALDTLISDICGLANFLKVKVPMCKANKVPFFPKFYTNDDFKLFPEETTVASQGLIEEETI